MERRSQVAFVALVIAQAAHSLEEYVFALYESFPVARFASSLVHNNLAIGFVVLNSAFVAFGLWCYFGPIRSQWPSARALAWLWVVVEVGNGLGHSALAVRSASYFPGVATAPLLLIIAFYLARQLGRTRPPREQPPDKGAAADGTHPGAPSAVRSEASEHDGSAAAAAAERRVRQAAGRGGAHPGAPGVVRSRHRNTAGSAGSGGASAAECPLRQAA